MRSFLQSGIKVREITCLRVSHEEKIAHLALVLACYELKRNATAEKKPHPSWRQSPAVRTAIPQNGRGGFLHKEPSDAAAHVLEGELDNMPTSGEHSCVTLTGVCDVFLERWAKKASSHQPDRNKSHELLIRWGLTLLSLLTPDPSWSVTRAHAGFLKRSTEELLQDSAMSLSWSQDTDYLIVQEFVLSSS